MRKSHVLALVGAVAFVATSVQAAIVIKPVGAVGDALSTANYGNAPAHLIDGSGLVTDAYAIADSSAQADYSTIAAVDRAENAHNTGSAVPSTWMRHTISGNQLVDFGGNGFATQGTTNYRSGWGNGLQTARVAFDLGASYDVSDIHFWNTQQWGTWWEGFASTKIYSISAAQYAGGLDAITVDGSGTAIDFGAQGASNIADRGTSFALSLSGAQYIMIDVLSTRGWADPTVAEVRFVGTTPVPEPTSLALLGVGSLLALKRRRA